MTNRSNRKATAQQLAEAATFNRVAAAARYGANPTRANLTAYEALRRVEVKAWNRVRPPAVVLASARPAEAAPQFLPRVLVTPPPAPRYEVAS